MADLADGVLVEEEFLSDFQFATQASFLMKARRPGSGKSEPRPRALDQSKAGGGIKNSKEPMR